MRGVLILAGVMIGLGTVMAQVADRMVAVSASAAPPVTLAVAEAPATGARSVVVPRDRQGHFRTEGRIEGQPIKFMIDTGASVVAINETAAARIGVRPAHGDFNARVSTANGVVKAARTRLAMVQVGDLRVRDVEAMVLPDEALSQNLLGLSFLGKLTRFEYAGGRMVLEQ
ncbi:MAG: TIGR02281 family clan AA aspartic protease [Xanthobacteraceae bacterium]|nr:TIGR02281 family clan AA aspartic protease [Xanthobacteraceae bacterium]